MTAQSEKASTEQGNDCLFPSLYFETRHPQKTRQGSKKCTYSSVVRTKIANADRVVEDITS